MNNDRSPGNLRSSPAVIGVVPRLPIQGGSELNSDSAAEEVRDQEGNFNILVVEGNNSNSVGEKMASSQNYGWNSPLLEVKGRSEGLERGWMRIRGWPKKGFGRRFLFEESWADDDDCCQIVEDCQATFLLGKLKTEINKKKRALILSTDGGFVKS
ncbi:hypothetical protein ACOSP7_022203 [Xanthoceras sorbifolium]